MLGGVFQGSMLDILLCVICIIDVDESDACKMLKFADDSNRNKFHIGTIPPEVEQKCVLGVINKIQVMYLCLYVTRARYS